ncbi:MAG: FKBP-type peptidyl-prolyl cis-trans isomerase [Bacteroidetes bacterium]|nr:FKBP-type peptidyl-prolyl cis-trans isomerase [Bacteroidota bacterium]
MQKNQYKLVLGFLIIQFLFQNNIYAGPPAPAPKTLSTLNALLKTVAKRDSAIEVYLKANKIYDVNVTPDGIYYTIESKGTGLNPLPKDYVSVNYTGFLLNGTQFSSSKTNNKPFAFQLGIGKVIQGWEKGIPLFKAGGKGKLFIPAQLAYGNQAYGQFIPPNAPLMFDVELLTVTTSAEYEANKQKELYLAQEKQRIQDSLLIANQKTMIEKYIADNNLKTFTTPSGLIYVVDEQGTGAKVENGKTAYIHYVGTLLDGSKFDSSRDRGAPFSFVVGTGRVIRGWDEGLPLFNVGGKGKLIIPPSLGYGARAMGPSLPGNSVLIFDIEVMDVK